MPCQYGARRPYVRCYPALVRTKGERRAKLRAIALLGSMAIVAAALWQWPSAVAPRESHVRADVVLPAPPLEAVPQTTLAPRVPERAPVPPVIAAATRPSHAPPPLDAFPGAAPGLPPAGPAPLAAWPAPVLPSSSHFPALDTPVPSRAFAMAAARPAAPAMTPALERADNPAQVLAHAGVALGDAFRRAGVSTAAAFSRIF